MGFMGSFLYKLEYSAEDKDFKARYNHPIEKNRR